MPGPVRFGVPADDPERAVRFSESIFGWKIQAQAGAGEIVASKMAVPGVGWLACFRGTEDNVSGVMEGNPSAK